MIRRYDLSGHHQLLQQIGLGETVHARNLNQPYCLNNSHASNMLRVSLLAYLVVCSYAVTIDLNGAEVGLNSAVDFTENITQLNPFPNIQVSHSADIIFMSLAMRTEKGEIPPNTGNEGLSTTVVFGLKITFTDVDGTLTVEGSADADTYQQVLAAVRYSNFISDLPLGFRTIFFSAVDANGNRFAEDFFPSARVNFRPVDVSPVLDLDRSDNLNILEITVDDSRDAHINFMEEDDGTLLAPDALVVDDHDQIRQLLVELMNIQDRGSEFIIQPNSSLMFSAQESGGLTTFT